MQIIRNGLSKVSVVNVVLGLVLLIAPTTSIKLVGYGLGGAAIVYGAVCIIRALTKGRGSGSIVWGVICCLFGLLVGSSFPSLVSFLPFIIGMIVLVSGLTKLQGALEARRQGYGWIMMLVGAVVSVGLGVLIMFNPFSTLSFTLRIIGIVLLVDGAENLIDAWVISRRMKAQGYLVHEGEDGIIDIVVEDTNGK